MTPVMLLFKQIYTVIEQFTRKSCLSWYSKQLLIVKLIVIWMFSITGVFIYAVNVSLHPRHTVAAIHPCTSRKLQRRFKMPH